MSQDSDLEFTLLKEHISKAQSCVNTFTKQLLENNLTFETDFSNETKEILKGLMADFLKLENEIKFEQHSCTQLEYKLYDLCQNFTPENDIDSVLNTVDVDGNFNSILEQQHKAETLNYSDNDQYKQLLNLLTDQNEGVGENEDVEMLETNFTIPIDPFSKVEIVNLVRNKVCKHFYDKDQFLCVFKNRPNNSSIKCPFTGCTNKKVFIDDVEEDPRMKILIDKAKRQQE